MLGGRFRILRAAAAELIAEIEAIAPESWVRVRRAGEWSPGKDAEQAAEAAAMHLWHIRASLGIHQAADPPAIQRTRLTATRSHAEILASLRTCAQDGARPVIRHLRTHEEEIARKLRAGAT